MNDQPAIPQTPSIRRWIFLAAVLAASALYALARYVWLGTTSPDNIPVYIGNKVVAISAAVAVLLAGLAHARRLDEPRTFWSKSATAMALLHVLLSLSVFGPAYYAKFFAGPRLTLAGELAILLGVLTAGAWLTWLRRAASDRAAARLAALCCLLLAGHLAAMGYSGWFKPATWPGGLPPITMLGVLFCLPAALLWARPGYNAADR